MITVQQNNDVYEIRFRYNPTLVQMVKQIPGRYYHVSQKYWTIPLHQLQTLIKQLKGTAFEDELKFIDVSKDDDTEEPVTKIPDYDISDVPFYVENGSHPYPHQLDFMKWALYRQNVEHNMHGFLLCDSMGLGKTIELMNLAIYNRKKYNFSRCLILCCVNPAKYHWYRDIAQHSNSKYTPYILGTRKKKRSNVYYANTGTKEKLEDLNTLRAYGSSDGAVLPYFIIMNIEGIRARSGKHYVIAERIIELINAGEISMIAIDEAHKNISASSSNGSQLLKIKKKTGNRAMWIPITGTPITSKPTDVYVPLKLVDGHKFKNYYTWCNKFCIHGNFGSTDIIGYQNISLLKSLLSVNMIRRTKEKVFENLPEGERLPEKIQLVEYVENTKYQEKLYRAISDEIEQQRESIIQSMNPLSAFLKLRQISEAPELVDETLDYREKSYLSKNAKLKRLLEIVEDIHACGEKVIIFDNWVQPLRMLYYILRKKYKVCVYTGTMSEPEREKHKHVFMTNPEYTIMLGTIGALGTMHTLTAATNMIFYNEPWNPSDKSQAEDRIHRIGTKHSVNIYTLIAKSTIDERVHDILYKKATMSSFIVDNIDIHNNPELFDYLMNDTGNQKDFIRI